MYVNPREDLDTWEHDSIEEFNARVEVRNPAQCWLWQGHRTPQGYNYYTPKTIDKTLSGIVSPARVLYKLHIGEITDERQASYYLLIRTCSTKQCVNPHHRMLRACKAPVGLKKGHKFTKRVKRAHAATQQHSTTCAQGHDLTAEGALTSGGRCRKCLWDQRQETDWRQAAVTYLESL